MGDPEMKTRFATTTRTLCSLVAACGLILAGTAFRPAPAQTSWITHPFGDESGSISLPDNWNIESTWRGAVQASAPGRLPRVDLGIGGLFWQPGTTLDPNTQVPYGNPAVAIAEALPRLWRFEFPGRVRARGARIVQQASWWQHGPAGYVELDWSVDNRQLRSRALVLMAPSGGGDGSWYYYHSMVTADAAQFASEWPTLHRIWSSYYSRVLPERVWPLEGPDGEPR
jgi:hypothetical protein